MTLMPIYTTQWEMRLATRDQRLVEAEQIRQARVLLSASEARQPKERSRPETSALTRLLTLLGHTGA